MTDKLVLYPDKRLKKEAQDVDVDLTCPIVYLPELKKRMIKVMLKNNGIGLAANQIGIDKKIFIIGTNEKNTKMYINPRIVEYGKNMIEDVEGCLSFPGIYIRVTRPTSVVVEYYNEELEEITEYLTGFNARVFMHECDHLYGITLYDHATTEQWELIEREYARRNKSSTS